MKIVHLTPYYPPHLGGVEVVAQQLSKALFARGIDVHVITSSIGQKGPGISTESPAGKVISRKGSITVEKKSAFDFAHIPLAPALLPSVIAALKDADLLHVHAGIAFYPEAGLIAAKLLKKPVVVTFHCDTEPSGTLGFLLPIYNKSLLKWVLNSADAVVCLAEDHAEVANKIYGVSKNKIRVIPNGIDEMFFSIGEKRLDKKAKSGSKETKRMLFVGRLAKQKNIPRLIDALNLVKNRNPNQKYLLTIAGAGEEFQSIKSQVLALKLDKEVIFLGALGKDNPKKWMELFYSNDIFVLPSDYEGVPLSLMEAMAAGIPTVATKVRGVREFAKDSSILVTPSASALANGIESLFNDSVKRINLSRKAKSAVSGFRWDRIAGEYLKVYQAVMK